MKRDRILDGIGSVFGFFVLLFFCACFLAVALWTWKGKEWSERNTARETRQEQLNLLSAAEEAETRGFSVAAVAGGPAFAGLTGNVEAQRTRAADLSAKHKVIWMRHGLRYPFADMR